MASIPESLHARLQTAAAADQELGIKQRFVDDTGRAERFSNRHEELYFDFSKTHISVELLEIYSQYAAQIGFKDKQQKLFQGALVNATEERPALHTLLRDPDNHGVALLDARVAEQARNSLTQFKQSFDRIQRNLASRATPITDIIHIGIGGSSLGTQLLFEALRDFDETKRIHFIGNIDGHQLASVLSACKPETTLVIGVSKTFGTAETLQNIRSVGQWFEGNGGADFWQSVFAVTANANNAKQFGVPESNTVTFPEWVGGRYSVWSAVSLSAALVIGYQRFTEFLEGAAAMDKHYLDTPLENNLSFVAAAIDHYYCNYFDAGSRAIFAYDYRLRSLVDYLQQLETESNGKDRQVDGTKVDQLTSPVIWGGVGTNVQHSVFQMLHQGTSLIPAEFILVARPDHDLSVHHQELLANGLAQPAALLAGQNVDDIEQQDGAENLTELAMKAKIFSGERPSTTILLESLTARSLGALLAFYEQRTYSFGVLCNINSFDQMGVELGKRLAKELRPMLSENAQNESVNFDASTLRLIKEVKDY